MLLMPGLSLCFYEGYICEVGGYIICWWDILLYTAPTHTHSLLQIYITLTTIQLHSDSLMSKQSICS